MSLFERGPAILAQEDEDIAAVAAAILTEEGIDIHVRAQVTEVHDSDAEATVVYEIGGDRRTVVVDAILAASGRAPATAQLGLEAAGIRVGDRGAIEVDAHLRTSQPHIYALGNVNGGPQHTYISFDDSRIVLDHLIGAGGRSTADRAAVIG